VENTIPEKVCKSAAVFAHNSGNGVSVRAIRGLYGLEKRGGERYYSGQGVTDGGAILIGGDAMVCSDSG
jgi:hypothetical protein